MIHQRFLLAAAFIILIHADLSAMAQLINCANNIGNYTTKSPYFDNLNYILSSLYKNIGDDGFYSAFTGEGIDRANAIALCAGDLQLNACRTCVQTAAVDLVSSCPNQKQAIRWAPDSSCMLRYSNATIYGAPAAVLGWYMLNLLSNVTSPEEFEADLRVLLEDLRRRAAAGDSTLS